MKRQGGLELTLGPGEERTVNFAELFPAYKHLAKAVLGGTTIQVRNATPLDLRVRVTRETMVLTVEVSPEPGANPVAPLPTPPSWFFRRPPSS